MTRYLLKFDRKRNWDVIPLEWLGAGEVRSDPITDLRTRDGKLSVWEIEEDNSNLELVLLALACTRTNFELIDFGLFDGGVLDKVGIPIERSKASTPVPRANGYHRDVVRLTVSRIAALVNALFFVIDKDRRLEGDVKRLIVDSWADYVDQDSVDERLRKHVDGELGG